MSAAGRYVLQHVFYDNGGSLAVDLNLLDVDGNVLFTEIRSNVADMIPSCVQRHCVRQGVRTGMPKRRMTACRRGLPSSGSYSGHM